MGGGAFSRDRGDDHLCHQVQDVKEEVGGNLEKIMTHCLESTGERGRECERQIERAAALIP